MSDLIAKIVGKLFAFAFLSVIMWFAYGQGLDIFIPFVSAIIMMQLVDLELAIKSNKRR